MLEALRRTAWDTIAQIKAIHDLIDHYRQRVRTALPKVYSHELIDVLFERPYCKINFLVKRGVTQRQTASAYLEQLVNAGLLQGAKVGRERIYINTDFLDLLRKDTTSPATDQP